MKYLVLMVLTAFALQGCKEIIAENISGKTPVIILPSNGQVVSENPVHFKWEAMSGATKYHLQVASPNFANISKYALDSIVSGTDFLFSLDSNHYELKITAMNAGYISHTLDSVFFEVGVSPSTGNGSTIVMTSPGDSTYFTSTAVFDNKLSWANLSGVSSYEVYLKKGSSFNSGTIVKYYDYVNPPYVNIESLNLGEGQFHWGVRGYMTDGSETLMAKRKFYIDTTSPNVPTLVTPNSPQNPGNVVFTWTNGNDPGVIHAPVNSTLEVAEDQIFTLNVKTLVVQGTTGTLNLTGSGPRFWRVKNIDAAGNSSVYSAVKQFELD